MIRFRGFDSLDAFEIAEAEKLAKAYHDKYERDLKELILFVDIKTYNRDGKRKKFSIHARIEEPIVSASAADWDLPRTLHKVFKNIENEIQHKFKTFGHKPRT